MSWNYRILAQKDGDGLYLQVHEVYYNEENEPTSCTINPITIGGSDLKSIYWSLKHMMMAKNKPILWFGDKFPQEVKITYTCELCGRNNFTKPSTHKCNGKFRKRKLKWSINYN